MKDTRDSYVDELKPKYTKYCPNCSSPLSRSKFTKSPHEMRYIFINYCRRCGFRHVVKIGTTKTGRMREYIPLTEGEIKLFQFAPIDRNGNIMVEKK